MCAYNEKYYTNYVEKIKYVECEKESKDISLSEFRIDNECVNESETSTFSGSTSVR